MIEEEEDTEQEQLIANLEFDHHDLETENKHEEVFVEAPMESESAAEVQIAKDSNLFGGVEKTEMFYKNQFNMLYDSGINIEGKNVD